MRRLPCGRRGQGSRAGLGAIPKEPMKESEPLPKEPACLVVSPDQRHISCKRRAVIPSGILKNVRLLGIISEQSLACVFSGATCDVPRALDVRSACCYGDGGIRRRWLPPLRSARQSPSWL